MLDLAPVAITPPPPEPLPGFHEGPPLRWFGARIFGYVDGHGIARLRIPTPEDPDPHDGENTYQRHYCPRGRK